MPPEQDDRNHGVSQGPRIPRLRLPTEPADAPAGEERNPFRHFLSRLGPGLVTGASDDDPSGIGTYAQVGASLGLAPLWTAFFSFPMMYVVQLICAKIGMITGSGLARVLRKHYSRWLLYPVVGALVVANTINAGVDIGAIAAAIHLVTPIPARAALVPIAVVILVVQILGSYRLLAKIFKWLTLALFAYVLSAFLSRPDWGAVLVATIRPTVRVDRDFLTAMVAILGTTISPYMFFWQADQEVEEEISMGRRTLKQRRGATSTELRDAEWDVAGGMLFSNVVMYFIILASASTLFHAGQPMRIQSATEAAQALRPLAGNAAYLLWAIGLIGAGMLSVPILTGSAAYAVAEALGWRHGLDERPRRAKLFYGMIAVSTLVGMMINFAGINAMTGLFWTAVINGVLAPPMLVIVMLIANNPAVLGRHINGPVANAVGWATTAVMFAAALSLAIV